MAPKYPIRGAESAVKTQNFPKRKTYFEKFPHSKIFLKIFRLHNSSFLVDNGRVKIENFHFVSKIHIKHYSYLYIGQPKCSYKI